MTDEEIEERLVQIPPLCKDCYYFRPADPDVYQGEQSVRYGNCARQEKAVVDPVTGEVSFEGVEQARDMRRRKYLCGPEGRWWTMFPKPMPPPRLRDRLSNFWMYLPIALALALAYALAIALWTQK